MRHNLNNANARKHYDRMLGRVPAELAQRIQPLDTRLIPGSYVVVVVDVEQGREHKWAPPVSDFCARRVSHQVYRSDDVTPLDVVKLHMRDAWYTPREDTFAAVLRRN